MRMCSKSVLRVTLTAIAIISLGRPATGTPRAHSAVAPKRSNAVSTSDTKRPFAPAAVEHYNKGVELHQRHDIDGAIDEYVAAVRADDRIEPAWVNLAGAYAARKQLLFSKEAFEKALSLKPGRTVTLLGYAGLLNDLGEIDEAEEVWRQIIELDPRAEAAYQNLALSLRKHGKTVEADKLIEELHRQMELRIRKDDGPT